MSDGRPLSYEHTQKAPLGLLLHGMAAMLVGAAWWLRDDWPAPIIVAGAACVLFAVGFMFAHLTVRDEGQRLAIRYGPLPVFHREIPFEDMTAVEASRSAIIDGWGIHWVPGRGWTYNLWGFACAKLTVRGRTIRIGSDDVDNLVAFLQSKLG